MLFLLSEFWTRASCYAFNTIKFLAFAFDLVLRFDLFEWSDLFEPDLSSFSLIDLAVCALWLPLELPRLLPLAIASIDGLLDCFERTWDCLWVC